MSDINDLYYALLAGKRANQALASWQIGADGYDQVRDAQRVIESGIAAYERLQRQLRDGQKHIEPPDNYKHTSCYCSAPTCSPPCGWCTDPERKEED